MKKSCRPLPTDNLHEMLVPFAPKFCFKYKVYKLLAPTNNDFAAKNPF